MILTRITAAFPLWALLLALVAYFWPSAWPDLLVDAKPLIVPLLGLVMFGMGMTLTWQSLGAVWRRPGLIGLGVLLQFLIMPCAAWAIARALGLSPALTAGLVLVGASPGGTASNVVCYLARGDLALSITLTAVSTLLAVVATPLLTLVYVGQQVPVPVLAMLVSVFKVVLLPVALGVLVNRLAGRWLQPLKHVFPLLSVLAIIGIIAIIVALNRDNLASIGALTALAVLLHNASGLILGYLAGRVITGDERTARTLAIEVGMQNSGLAVALAVKYFGASAALPGALFSVWHNLSGSMLAAVWSRWAPQRRGRVGASGR
jgi:BASS family bile acid:Na+ symporter